MSQDTVGSGSFLGLVVGLLCVAVFMVAQPDLARAAVFPFVLVGWLISLCLHEFGHAIAAYYGGDLSVREKGYLTLDPLHYTNVQFSIIWPLVFLALGGIGLPGGAVYVNMGALRSPAYRSLVSAAGPFATLLVLMLLLVIMATVPASPILYAALAFLAFLQLSALVLTLLPVPGLDGWGIIEPWLPSDLRESGWRLAPIGPTLLFLAFFLVPPVNQMFWRLVFDLAQIIHLDARAAFQGLHLFQFWR
jgi:Zn-dependent protease